MKRTPLLAAAALLLGGCADNRTSIDILGRAAPNDTTTCTFTAGGQSILGPGKLDVSFNALTYKLVVYVDNNLVDPKTLVPEALSNAKDWSAESARVRVNPKDYTDQFGASPALLDFTGENVIPLDGQKVAPAGGRTTQFVDAVSASLGAQLRAALPAGQTRRVVLGITLRGHTNDGAHLDSGEWYFPVDICNGCLQPVAACTGTQTLTSTSCFGFGQDTQPVCK